MSRQMRAIATVVGRQGYRGRTHLTSPAMDAAADVTGPTNDVRELT